MSIRYGAFDVSVTLKDTVPPALVLMSVANPCSVESPAPETSQVDCGVPGSWFSVTIGFVARSQRLSSASSSARCRLAGETRRPRRGGRADILSKAGSFTLTLPYATCMELTPAPQRGASPRRADCGASRRRRGVKALGTFQDGYGN